MNCSDGNACTTDKVLNGGTCSATCWFSPINQCVGGDSCCPTGCNGVTDSDCPAICGNGLLEGLETCDTAIAAGQPGACPTTCQDGDACTLDTMLNPGTCKATCSFTAINQCTSGDGCCPAGCTPAVDSECSSSTGDDPVAYWKFEGDGVDATGHGFDLSSGTNAPPPDGHPCGAVSYGAGLLQNAVGTGSTIWGNDMFVGSAPLLQFSGDFTISLWAYRTAPVYDSDTLMQKVDEIYLARRQDAAATVLYVATGPSQYVILVDNSGAGNPLNQWYHVIAYRQGNTIGLVVNGKGSATATMPSGPYVGNSPLLVGRNSAGYPWQGMIDEIGIWNRTLSGSEIAYLYNGGTGARPPLP
jgi:hypothetical protein